MGHCRLGEREGEGESVGVSQGKVDKIHLRSLAGAVKGIVERGFCVVIICWSYR